MASRQTMASPDVVANLLGLLEVRVKKGHDLVVRDVTASDPYVVIKMGDQKLRTRVIHNDINPTWDNDLIVSVKDATLPINLVVYDYDVMTKDDRMGDAQFDIIDFVEALKMPRLDRHPDGTVLKRIQPSRKNCLAEDSCIIWKDNAVVQLLCLRLRNVPTGEVEIELRWINPPGCIGL